MKLMTDWVFDWDSEKNALLKKQRGICFEDIVSALESGCLCVDEPHPNPDKYPHQHQIAVLIDDYAIVVPYVLDHDRQVRFLKTLYPSRKYTKYFLSLIS